MAYFYAVALPPRDGLPRAYLGTDVDKLLRAYKRERLDKAAIFTSEEHATLHATTFNEPHLAVVKLLGVTEPGTWRGWYREDHEGFYLLHGPNGETLVHEELPVHRRDAKRLFWTARRPDGRELRDLHERPRRFASAEAARKALKQVEKTIELV